MLTFVTQKHLSAWIRPALSQYFTKQEPMVWCLAAKREWLGKKIYTILSPVLRLIPQSSSDVNIQYSSPLSKFSIAFLGLDPTCYLLWTTLPTGLMSNIWLAHDIWRPSWLVSLLWYITVHTLLLPYMFASMMDIIACTFQFEHIKKPTHAHWFGAEHLPSSAPFYISLKSSVCHKV
jgi:hypothetical protein